jgi:hypothetical protein
LATELRQQAGTVAIKSTLQGVEKENAQEKV